MNKFITLQRIESGDPNVKATTRTVIVKPVGRARDAVNKELGMQVLKID